MPDTGKDLELNRKVPGCQLWECSHLDGRIHILNICTTADPVVERLGMGQTRARAKKLLRALTEIPWLWAGAALSHLAAAEK